MLSHEMMSECKHLPLITNNTSSEDRNLNKAKLNCTYIDGVSMTDLETVISPPAFQRSLM
jgi:hypothetical protein